MQYMIIEKFHPGKQALLYDRFDKKGRMLPANVHYINSWIDAEVNMCFQLIESESEEALHEWIENWKDVADFEIYPVVNSKEARAKILG